MLRLILIVLVINLVIVGFILAGKSSRKAKAGWTAVLLVIPLIGLAIYYFLQGRKHDRTASLKEWEKL